MAKLVAAGVQMTLPCIVCGAKLEPAFAGLPDNQPMKGTTFKGYGQYGSTAYDPMDGSYLEVNVCDKCLMRNADKGRVLHCTPTTRVTVASIIWNGTDSYDEYYANPTEESDSNGSVPS